MMEAKNKSLFLFTDSFPYFTNEVYIETEILYLSKKFNKIFIFPINIGGTIRNIPDNVEIINIHELLPKSKLKFFFISFWLFLKIYISATNKKSLTKNFKKNLLTTFNAALCSSAFESFIKNKKIAKSDIVLYSYWFLHWSFVISVLKMRNPLVKAFSRAHMGDLYDNLCDHTFSEFKLQNLDKVYSISFDGKNHLCNLFPDYDKKMDVSYLGVNHIGTNPASTDLKSYTIASCSAMNSHKRIDSFFDILSHVKLNVTWVHFGGMDSEIIVLRKKAESLPKNIKVIFYGYMPNEKVSEYYQNNHVDLFLNLSLFEGIPVTIMEAISFSIPAMATNVCGSPEIINYDIGMLIDKDFDDKAVALRIEDFLETKANDAEYRKKVLSFWNSNFDAAKNYKKFADIINTN